MRNANLPGATRPRGIHTIKTLTKMETKTRTCGLCDKELNDETGDFEGTHYLQLMPFGDVSSTLAKGPTEDGTLEHEIWDGQTHVCEMCADILYHKLGFHAEICTK
jgi:hypothetical protein